eukprot:454632-Amphidinium_carterae.1
MLGLVLAMVLDSVVKCLHICYQLVMSISLDSEVLRFIPDLAHHCSGGSVGNVAITSYCLACFGSSFSCDDTPSTKL